MSETITASGAIRYFSDRIRQIDQDRIGYGNGNEPSHPMLIVFLGNDAMRGYSTISTKLFQMWPQFKEELRFLGISESGRGITYTGLDGESATVIEMQADDIGSMVSLLFGKKSHYQDRSMLLIYYVLDTTSFKNESDFMNWMDAIAKFKKDLAIETVPMSDMLFLLLNENIGERQRIAAQVRAASGLHIGKDFTSELILSNFRSDNVILEDWEDSYHIIADIVALTNNSDSRVARAMMCEQAFTVSYACEEKPSESIGQVIIMELSNYLVKEGFEAASQLFQEEETFERLGFTKERTLQFLDHYAENFLFKLLPSDEQLALFPRKTDAACGNLSQKSEEEFDELTMGSWLCFLNQIVQRAQIKIKGDLSIRTRWKEDYETHLLSSFTVSEIIWLRDHMEELRRRFHEARKPSGSVAVLSAAKSRLRYLLSTDAEIIEIFIGAIENLGDRAKEFLRSWGQFLQSRLSVHAVKDENLEAFYSRKVTNFLNFNGLALAKEMQHIMNMDEMTAFLYRTVDQIIESDPFFSVSFEQELQGRLQNAADAKDAQQYIQEKLTGSDVPLYYRGVFALGTPVASAVMLKVGTPLHANLTHNLPSSTYYYDTGCGDAAEAIKVYAVSRDNLVVGIKGGSET